MLPTANCPLTPQMTNWDYYEAVRRFQRVLSVSGINSALLAKGIKEVGRGGSLFGV